MRVQRENIEEFRERFFDFFDGVVHSLSVQLRSEPSTCTIDIECKDRDLKRGWSHIRSVISEVREFRFEMAKTTFEVLSSGLQFFWRDELIYLLLDAYPDDGGELPDLKRNTAYVAGASCVWEILD